MRGPAAPRRARVTPGTAVRAAAAGLGAVVVLVSLDRARPVIEWLVVATAVALLLDGPVQVLARRMRRGLAVGVVTAVTLVATVLIAYGVADAVYDQYRRLQDAAPAAAADIARSPRLGEFAARVDLVERTRDVVDEAPERLLGSPARAAQTAAELLGEFVLVVTLAVFVLGAYGRLTQRLVRPGALGQRWPPAGFAAGVVRGAGTARHAVGRAILLGALTAALAAAAGVPGPVALGLWMAWWRLVPLLGVVVGYAPLLLLLVTGEPAWVAALTLLGLVGAELLVLWVERSTRPRPTVPMGFVSAVAVSAGFELGGAVGSVAAVVVAHVVVGALGSVAAASATNAEPIPR